MNKIRSLLKRTWQHLMHDSLRRNSMFLIAGQAISAISGFLFWMICARIFDPKTIGLATAFISFGTLVTTFTTLGLPTIIIRFLPTSKNKPGLLGATIWVCLGFSLLGSLVAVWLIRFVAPDLTIVQTSVSLATILILFIVTSSISPLLDNTLMAFKKGHYMLIKALMTNIPRIILPFFLASWALNGLVLTFVVLTLLGVIYGLTLVKTRLLPDQRLTPEFREISSRWKFGINNYLGSMVGILPKTLVPIIVLNELGAAQAAFYFMPMQLASFLGIISSSASQALVSEASQHEDPKLHREQLIKAVKHLFHILIPTIFLMSFIGWIVLHIYGKAYAVNGYIPLVILCVSSIFGSLNWIGDTWLLVKKRMLAYSLMNGINSLLVVGLVFIFVHKGLTWTAVGWIIGQAISVVIYGLLLARGYLWSLLRRW